MLALLISPFFHFFCLGIETPAEKKAREKAESIRRVRKLARKAAQREGEVTGRRKR